jgi:hypothetical protein
MEVFLLFVALAVVVIRWWILSQRYDEMERRIEMASRGRVESHEFAELLRRVYKLEGTVAALERTGSEPAPAFPLAEPEPEPPAPLPVEIPVAIEVPPELPEVALEHADTLAPSVQPLVQAPSRLTEPEPPRRTRSSEEWEAVVGGNWFNKLGIFVLVMAIALFLGYSFTQLGPAGRSGIGLAVSFALLAGGVALERRAAYVIFGRGLLAGGWAGLYFTTYAMQAVDAAKVIHNPVLGGLLLFAVAAGMVVHSLRYRAQALTGLAYAVAFGSLAITPVTALSVAALVPLAGSLLVVAYRFSWPGMSLFGLLATYATCASRGDSGAPLWSAQTVFAAYWLLFEAYDLLRARRRSNHAAERAILPLNALCFAGLSWAKWSAAAPWDMYLLASGIAAAYLASTILRAVLRPPASFPAETSTLERIFAGGYEGPITLAAVCSVAAAVLKLHGQTVNNALLAEGELLFLAGLVFRQAYPRMLAGWLFTGLGVKLLITDIPGEGMAQVAGLALRDWTPSAAIAALVFYLNRGLRKTGRSYGYAAAALVALALGYEIPLRYLGVTWLGFGALLFLSGWRFRLFDFRAQGYAAGGLALGAMAWLQVEIAAGTITPLERPWVALAIAAAVAYGAALCALRAAPDRLPGLERRALQAIASAAASAALAAVVWRTVPAAYLGPAWLALGIAALEPGLRRLPADFRIHAHIIAGMGAARVLLFAVLPLHPIVLAEERIAIGCAAALAYAYAARLFAARPEQAPGPETRNALNTASAAGSLFALVELWALLGPVAVAPAWAVFALALIGVGFRAKLPGLRMQGHAAAAAAFGRLLAVNFDASDSIYGVSQRLWSVAAVAACHYFEWWRERRVTERLREWERHLSRPYLYAAAGLIAGLLYFELRPPFVAAGWAGLTLALLIAGRRWNLPDLQYQSYALAVITFWRTLNQEFVSSPDFANSAERIAAGALAALCLFAAQLFAKRGPEDGSPAPDARMFFSLLASSLATAFLFHEVSGSMLTVAWGMEGAALLAAGFPLRDRTLRLSGLALFLICVGKLFLYDLRELETLYRILSFFVLGVILVAVSWLYTRFRGRIQRYL